MKGEQAPGARYQVPESAAVGAVDNWNEDADVAGFIAELQGLMWRDAGLLRDAAGLRRAQDGLAELRERMPQALTRRAQEARNLHAVAQVIVQAALGRDESRGAHFRMDFPGKAKVALHSVVERGRLRFVERG